MAATPDPNKPATNGEVKKDLNLQTLVIMVTLVGTILGGARWVVTSSWAQAKEHADAGQAVLDAKLEAHIKEEAGERERTRGEVQLMRVEQYDMRKELRGLYDYQKTGREPEAFKQPLPPPPVPLASKDGGR